MWQCLLGHLDSLVNAGHSHTSTPHLSDVFQGIFREVATTWKRGNHGDVGHELMRVIIGDMLDELTRGEGRCVQLADPSNRLLGHFGCEFDCSPV